MTKATSKRRPQDLTLRNNSARKKEIAQLREELAELWQAFEVLKVQVAMLEHSKHAHGQAERPSQP